MGTKPPVCLQLNCTASASQATLNSNATYQVTVELPAGSSGQSYYDETVSPPQYLNYDCTNIKSGQWLAGAAPGYAWRILQVVADPDNSSSRVILLVEDVNNFNAQIDSESNGFSGAPQSSADPTTAVPYLLFELNSDGVPIFTPTAGLLGSGFMYQIIPDIVSRFASQSLNKQYINVYQAGHTFAVGDPICVVSADSSGNAVYTKAVNLNSKYTLGIVSSVGNPDANAFAFKSIGTYYSDISRFFTDSTLNCLFFSFSN